MARQRDSSGRYVKGSGSSSSGTTVKGVSAMQKKIDKIASTSIDQMMGAIHIEAELIMTDSKQNYVPVDLGTLRSSGHVGKPVRHGKDIEITLDYGGAAAPYALAVHEHPSGYSPPTWEGVEIEFSPKDRGPKYLERPLRAAIPGMADRIAKRITGE